jgi:hypothetical protein
LEHVKTNKRIAFATTQTIGRHHDGGFLVIGNRFY